MIEVGVREFKRDLSGYLKRAAEGEQVRVTMRGAPLVDLVPPGSRADPREAFDALTAAGRITPATRDHRSVIAQLGVPPALQADPHALLLAERAAERRKSSRRAGPRTA
jgi:prevent-host-death family protein